MMMLRQSLVAEAWPISGEIGVIWKPKGLSRSATSAARPPPARIGTRLLHRGHDGSLDIVHVRFEKMRARPALGRGCGRIHIEENLPALQKSGRFRSDVFGCGCRHRGDDQMRPFAGGFRAIPGRDLPCRCRAFVIVPA
jgi:hypothetical protein